MGIRLVLLGLLGPFAFAQSVSTFSASDFASGDNCTYKANPDAYTQREARAKRAIYERMASFSKTHAAETPKTNAVAASTIPRQNFIDDEIFNAMDSAKVSSAPLSGDAEFLRRVTLDLTGRVPSSADVRAFVADQGPSKRNALIDKLLWTPEFTDKWTMWLGDLVENIATAVNVSRQITARKAFYKFLWINVTHGHVSLKDTANNIITATGNTNDEPSAASYILGGIAPGGPADDEYDMLAYKTAKMFLGLGNYDCLMCHNGRGHLDQINLWAAGVQRTDAEHMSAFFSHERRTGFVVTPTTTPDQMTFYANSTVVNEATNTNSNYTLPTTNGNRPNRALILGSKTASPIYRSGQTPGSNNWRAEYAKLLVNDPMFSTNFANRLWKAMFNYGLVDTQDTLDPARLDPDNPPGAPWTLQATHPRLLTRLASEFVNRNYSLREFLRLITESSAYQLSSNYGGDWDSSTVPLFARHYARRLEGEEIHDAIVKATGSGSEVHRRRLGRDHFLRDAIAGYVGTAQQRVGLQLHERLPARQSRQRTALGRDHHRPVAGIDERHVRHVQNQDDRIAHAASSREADHAIRADRGDVLHLRGSPARRL